MKQKLKAQINMEFITSAALYILALGAIVTASSNVLPSYSQNTDRTSLNLEARSLTNQILSNPGRHDFGEGGTDWENNGSTINNTSAFGLATDFLKVERGKIENISTTSTKGPPKFNYTQFKQVTGVDNQYRLEFTWFPIVHTNRSFTRGNPPSDPDIEEPTEAVYSRTDNEVHYGSITLDGQTYQFLVTAHDGTYNTTYVIPSGSDPWNFRDASPRGVDDTFFPSGPTYTIESFQNRAGEPGSAVFLKDKLKTFGASIDSDSIVIKMVRFAIMEKEPLRIEVWAW